MEKKHIIKNCPWITEDPVKVKSYFEEYHALLDSATGKPHHEQIFHDDAIRDFFPIPVPVVKQEGSWKAANEPIAESKDPLDPKKLEKDCSIDLLTVDDELMPNDTTLAAPRLSGRLANWYAGSFQDGVIPDRVVNSLETLKAQSEELRKRMRDHEYARLRQRGLKYFSTVRMVINPDNSPIPMNINEDLPKESLKDIVLNIRIQRPYHKKTHLKKACNKFPSHSQELLMLGKQHLTELCDAIICINDLAINQDFSRNPDVNHLPSYKSNSAIYPSGFFYINGVFYNDMRHPFAKNYAEGIINWAKRSSDIGKMKYTTMEDVKMEDLELRLGYPYVFLHQGNCEHIITITDIRLHHSHDVQDPSSYPLLRGQASKLSVMCAICNLRLACWIVQDEPRLPVPNAHVCDRCLRSFCYDSKERNIADIKVFPFFDEFMTQQKKLLYTNAVKSEPTFKFGK